VRKAGNRVRITAQLIDATSGNHLWADRFDGSLDDVFDLQDQITEQIVVAVEPEIGARERERARRKPPENLDAWELLQRGLSHFQHINKADHAEAMRLFREAIALDPEFAAAHAYLAFALSTSVLYGYVEDTAKAVASARAAAEQAVSLDSNEPMARFALGRVHSFAGEIAMAIGETQTAIAINPNFAWGHFGLGFAYHYGAGQAEQSLPHYDAALRLSPRDPRRWLHLMMKGSALRGLGRHDEAVAKCRQACQIPDSGFLSYVHLAAASAEAGQKSEAQAAVEKATQLEPALSIDFIRNNFVGMHETTLKSLLDSLRKAGVPE
jgi:tetratricopeptide (TPR) repeat protein